MRSRSARTAVIRPWMVLAVAATALAGLAQSPARAADPVEFSIPAQPLAAALTQLGQQARVQVLFDETLVRGLTAPPVRGRLTPHDALQRLLSGTDLTAMPSGQGTFAVRRAGAPPAPPAGAGPAVAAGAQVAQAEERPHADPVDLPGVTVRGLIDQFGYKVDEVLAGTKTRTPALDVPNSVQVVPRQIIDDQQDLRLIDVVRNISGVSVPFTNGGRSERFVIRGFTTEDVFKNFFRDDAFSGSRTARDLQNIDRVEVVKGPASVLYGRMDPAGAILLFTKQPLDRWHVNPQMIFGSYDLYRPTLDVTGPLNESRTVLGRFNAAYETAGSFRDFVTTERVLAAPVLSWAPRPGTLLTLEGEYLHSDAPIDRGLVAVNQGVANIPISTFLGDPSKRDTAEQGKAYLVLNHAFNEAWSLRSAFRWAIASEDYRSIEAQSLQANNRTLNLIASIQPRTFQSYYLQNDVVGTFTTGPIGHQLLAGLELGHLTGQQKSSRASAGTLDIFNPTYTFTVGRFTLRQDATNTADEVGLYVQNQATLLPGLKAVAGLRFDYYDQESTNKLTSTTQRQDDQAFTPRVGLVYQPFAPASLYFNWSRSFIPQFGTDFGGNQFDPETGEQFEVGAKVSLLGGRLLATVALFQISKNNVLTADPLNPGFQIDAGSQRSRGVELDVTGQILPGWNVIASYAYTDAVVTASNDFPVGNTLANVPRNAGSLWTTYTIQGGPLRGLGFGGGIFAAGQRYGDLNDSFRLPAYIRTNLAVYYTRGPFYAALNAKNVANVTYYEGAQDRTSVIPGAPLTFLGTIGLKF